MIGPVVADRGVRATKARHAPDAAGKDAVGGRHGKIDQNYAPTRWRKIHGQLKNVKGARWLSILLACFETWKLRGLNPMIEMAKWA